MSAVRKNVGKMPTLRNYAGWKLAVKYLGIIYGAG